MRCDQVAVLIEHTHQQLAVPLLAGALVERRDLLDEKLKPAALHRLADFLHPARKVLVMPVGQVRGLVAAHTVAAFPAGDQAGGVRGAQGICKMRRGHVDRCDADAGADLKDVVFPRKTQVAHGLAQVLADGCRVFEAAVG